MENSAEFSDEFDRDTVNSSKLYGLNPKWTGRPPSVFAKDNVLVRDGKLVILGTTVEPADPLCQQGLRYKTGMLKCHRPNRYDYFNIQAYIAKSRVLSAFRLSDYSKFAWTDIDVFDLCGRAPCSHVFHTTAHARLICNETSKTICTAFPEKLNTSVLLRNGSVNAAFERDAGWLRWYVNRELIHQLRNIHWHDSLYNVIDSEGFTKWFGAPSEDEFFSEYVVDYVRVWQRADQAH